MKRLIVLLFALTLPVTSYAAQPADESDQPAAQVRYIVDVEGKKVRAVGPRFLPNQTSAFDSLREPSPKQEEVAVSVSD